MADKKLRNLSGIYLRTKVNGEWENVVFEDLSEEEQNRVLVGRSRQWLKSLAKKLADTLNEIGEKFNIIKE